MTSAPSSGLLALSLGLALLCLMLCQAGHDLVLVARDRTRKEWSTNVQD